MTKAGRGGFGTTLILALLLVIVSVAAGVGIGYLIWNQQPDKPPIVQGVRRLNELATVEQTIQVMVTEEENAEIFQQPLPEFLTGERLLLVAVGEVEAGVNLDKLEEGDVRVLGETVIIDLPQASILDSSLDEDATMLYDRDRGLLKLRGNDALIEEARRDALEKIQEEATNTDVLEQAQNNAEASIRSFVTSLGYDKVVVE